MFEDVKEYTEEQVETRRNEISNLLESDAEVDLSAISDELDALNSRKAEIKAEKEERKEDIEAVISGAGDVISKHMERETRTMNEIRSSQEYLDAYVRAIKTGSDKECRALLTELTSEEVTGAVPVPQIVDDYIATAWERSGLLDRVRKTNIKGVAKYPFELSATGASIHAEGAAAPAEETLQIGVVTITPQMIKKWLPISDEVMALTGQAFLDYIFDEIEYRIVKLADEEIINAIKSSPSAATETAPGVYKNTAATIDAFTILGALANLADEARNPVAIMNKSTFFNRFMSLKDLQNRPIFDIVSANGKPEYYLNGVPVIFNDSLQGGSTGVEIIVGDLSGVVVNLPEGREVNFITDPYSMAEQDMVKIVGKMYAGIGVVRDSFFAYIKESEAQS